MGIKFGCLQTADLASDFEVKDGYGVLFAGPEVT
jgi:hypothetical protein